MSLEELPVSPPPPHLINRTRSSSHDYGSFQHPGSPSHKNHKTKKGSMVTSPMISSLAAYTNYIQFLEQSRRQRASTQSSEMSASILRSVRALPQLARLDQNFSQQSQICLPIPPVCLASRGKKTKATGSSKNRQTSTVPKNRGHKVKDGDFVHKGTILATQYGMRWYPGEHVVMERDCTLRAAYDGIVVISTEALSPYPDSPLYEPVQAGLVIQKKFFHIIPTPLHGKFRLLSET